MRHYKFTLVELLVVICIASLLMGLVLPAFSRMITGSAVDRLASDLKLRLERAQSHAASSRRHVAVILPNGAVSEWLDPSADRSSKVLVSASLGGSRECYVDEVEASNSGYVAKFVRWLPDEEWSTPERGALIVAFSGENPLDANGKLSVTHYLNHNSSLTSTVINGSGRGAPLKKINGVTTTVGNEGKWKNEVPDAGIIFSPQGGVRSSSDVYIVVAEAMKDNQRAIFPGGELHNFRVLKINRLTGRVEYHK